MEALAELTDIPWRLHFIVNDSLRLLLEKYVKDHYLNGTRPIFEVLFEGDETRGTPARNESHARAHKELASKETCTLPVEREWDSSISTDFGIES